MLLENHTETPHKTEITTWSTKSISEYVQENHGLVHPCSLQMVKETQVSPGRWADKPNVGLTQQNTIQLLFKNNNYNMNFDNTELNVATQSQKEKCYMIILIYQVPYTVKSTETGRTRTKGGREGAILCQRLLLILL